MSSNSILSPGEFYVSNYAWAAGIIDGEGCITIGYHKPNTKNGSRNPSHRLLLKVTMTDESTVRRLLALFKVGTIQTQKVGSKEAGKPRSKAFSWLCNREDTLKVLELVYSYLYTKREQAHIAIEFATLPRQTGSSNITPRDLLERRHALYVKMHYAKQIHTTTGRQPHALPDDPLPGKEHPGRYIKGSNKVRLCDL